MGITDKHVIYRAMSFTDLEALGIKITLSDLEGELEIASITHKGKSYSLQSLLHQVGIRDNVFVHVSDKSTHVRATGQQTYNHRLVGEERNDRKWLMSGHASDEIQLASSKMRDMSEQLSRLSSGGDR